MAEVLVFKVSAPRLEDLNVNNCFLFNLIISAPKLSSFGYSGHCPVSLSTNGLQCLEKVDLHLPMLNPLSNFNKEDGCQLFKLLKDFHNARFLNFHSNVIEALSLYPDLLSSQPSPFHNLKHLNIRQGNYTMLTVPNHIRNYFLHSSPSATITTGAP